MGCLHCNFESKCNYFDSDEEYEMRNETIVIDYGFDKEGNCVVEEDPDPESSCPYFESDSPEEEEEE